jgi:beta-phosphoglucomutase-like phosphatase (HAD superfamily)
MVALPAKGKLKGVLYDIDGTLVNSDPLHYLA